MINKILIICPSRSRPANALNMYKSFLSTTSGLSDFCFVLDNDDPEISLYPSPKSYDLIPLYNDKRTRLGPCLNIAFEKYNNYKYYGFLGDDHRFRTKSWDTTFINKIINEGKGFGVCYGNDLLQKDKLPTAVVISANILNFIGYFSLPGLIHFKIDRFWKELGLSINKLFYFENVIIEHMHMSCHKSKNDIIYEESHTKDIINNDNSVFSNFKKNSLPAIASKLSRHIKNEI